MIIVITACYFCENTTVTTQGAARRAERTEAAGKGVVRGGSGVSHRDEHHVPLVPCGRRRDVSGGECYGRVTERSWGQNDGTSFFFAKLCLKPNPNAANFFSPGGGFLGGSLPSYLWWGHWASKREFIETLGWDDSW